MESLLIGLSRKQTAASGMEGASRLERQEVDLSQHTYRSPEFEGVVAQAGGFLDLTPLHPLPPAPFPGVGVYAIYYNGKDPLYQELSLALNPGLELPIYIGKAPPRGTRQGRARQGGTPEIYRRLSEHARSIDSTTNLSLSEFLCRFIILRDTEVDLIVPVESYLIRKYLPLWNSFVTGFGNHDPGSGRYNQARSEWDTIHPGRTWADRLQGVAPDKQQVISKIRQILSSLS